ncbi:MAG TPA: hypothetical protein VGL00_07980 [Terracidiphilus sp.]|jgi:hypothetical protein
MQLSWRIWAGAIVGVAVIALIWTRIPWLRHRTPPAAIPDRAMTSPLNLPGGGTAPAEAYEVYSALYHEAADEPLVFSNDSVTDIPQVNGSCLRPSTPQERELTSAFEAANQQTHRWEQKFSIPQGYRLLSRSEASDAQNCLQSHAQDAARCQPYKQIRHLRYLAVPGFDRTHEHALVSVVKMCGHYCGNGGIFEVEKTGGTWRRSKPGDFTSECSWMY